MKANRFLKDETAAVNTQTVFNIVILVVLVTALAGLVASQVTTAQADANITGTNDTLLGLLLLVFILVPVIGIFGFLTSRKG